MPTRLVGRLITCRSYYFSLGYDKVCCLFYQLAPRPLTGLSSACNHPSLVSKDYKEDLDAVDSKEAKKDSADVDGDDLVAAFDQLNVSKKCKVCTTTYVSTHLYSYETRSS